MQEPIWVDFPLSLYESGKYKTAISLKGLVDQTNSFSTKNKDGCVPRIVESDPRRMYMRYNVKCSLKTSDPNGHDVRIKFDTDMIGDGSRYDNVNVKVSCSCPAFLYWGAQWNLNHQDALEGQPRPLLQAPTERLDLRNQFLICKHVKVVLDRVVGPVQRVINDIARKKRVEENTRPKGDEEVEVKFRPGTPGAPAPETPLKKKDEEGNPVLPYVPSQDKPKTPEPEPEEVAPVDEDVTPEPQAPEPEEAEVAPEAPADTEDEERRAKEEAERKKRLNRRKPKPGEGTIDYPADRKPQNRNLNELQGGPAPRPKKPNKPKRKTREDLPRVRNRSGVID